MSFIAKLFTIVQTVSTALETFVSSLFAKFKKWSKCLKTCISSCTHNISPVQSTSPVTSSQLAVTSVATMSNSRSVPDTQTLATSINVLLFDHLAPSVKSNRIEPKHMCRPPNTTLLDHIALSPHPTKFLRSSTESVHASTSLDDVPMQNPIIVTCVPSFLSFLKSNTLAIPILTTLLVRVATFINFRKGRKFAKKPAFMSISVFATPNVHDTQSLHSTKFLCSSTESAPGQLTIQRSVIPAVRPSFSMSPRNTHNNACSIPSKNENPDVIIDTIYSKGGSECEALSASANPLQNENVPNLVTLQYVNIIFNNLIQIKM